MLMLSDSWFIIMFLTVYVTGESIKPTSHKNVSGCENIIMTNMKSSSMSVYYEAILIIMFHAVKIKWHTLQYKYHILAIKSMIKLLSNFFKKCIQFLFPFFYWVILFIQGVFIKENMFSDWRDETIENSEVISCMMARIMYELEESKFEQNSKSLRLIWLNK